MVSIYSIKFHQLESLLEPDASGGGGWSKFITALVRDEIQGYYRI